MFKIMDILNEYIDNGQLDSVLIILDQQWNEQLTWFAGGMFVNAILFNNMT